MAEEKLTSYLCPVRHCLTRERLSKEEFRRLNKENFAEGFIRESCVYKNTSVCRCASLFEE